ncbi:MAG: DUF4350 domain-containing protein [Chitinophagaceae bacterium]|nr:DUF4350 domain-containing protein [Chitinophagaceae bacterium]
MKRTITYLVSGLLAAVLIVSCNSGSELPSLNETFARNDKSPFGTYAAYRMTSQLFYYNDVKTWKTPLEKSLNDNYDSSSFYINISKNFYLSAKDLDAMLSFVNRGNSMFISSQYFDTAFFKTIDIPAKQPSVLFEDFIADKLRPTDVQLQPAYYFDSSLFGYFYLPLNNSFDVHSTANIKVLGNNEDGKPNFVLVFYGKGRFYLHCEPRVLGNYFMLQKDNYKYLQHLFSFITSVPEHVFWDDFYNKRNTPPSEEEGRSGLSVLLQYPAMAWAFWLTLLLLLLYILFGSKRRQRIIKPLASNENTSVAFTETVSRLYLQKKDNRNIADKMITYFYEQIRNQYFLNTNQVNEEFISTLSRKSNAPQEETAKLFGTIHKVQQSVEVSDQQLLLLNHQIETFYKHNR